MGLFDFDSSTFDFADVLSAAAQVWAANMVADGTIDAAEQNNAATTLAAQMANEFNLDLYNRTQGSDGTALLPDYFRYDYLNDPESPQSFETDMARYLMGISQQELDQYENGHPGLAFGDQSFADMVGAFGRGNQFINDIYTGELAADRQALVDKTYGDVLTGLDNRHGNSLEVIDDYLDGQFELVDEQAELNKQASNVRTAAINSSLGDRLKQIQFDRNRRGFGGESSFSNSLMQGATTQARQDAGIADVNDRRDLVNAKSEIINTAFPSVLDQSNRSTRDFMDVSKAFSTDTIGGFDTNRALQGSMLDAPIQRAKNSYDFGMLPEDSKWRGFDNTMSRMGYFATGGGNPPSAVVPNLSPTGNSDQIWGATLQSIGKAWDRLRNPDD